MFWFRWKRLSGSQARFDLDQAVVVALVVDLDPVLIVPAHEVDVPAMALGMALDFGGWRRQAGRDGQAGTRGRENGL
jgi:hypothetical protein